MSDTAWSDDRVATLSKLWTDGLSAAQIAKQLGGLTRNAVIGKVHRLGLSGRRAASAPRMKAVRPVRAVRAPLPSPRLKSVSKTPATRIEPEVPGLCDSLTQLPAHACKWPIGDPKSAGFSFCGRRADGRYCAEHETLGVRRGTAWRLDRDLVVKRALAGLV